MQTWTEHAQHAHEAMERDAESRHQQREEQRQPLRVKVQKIADALPPERAQRGVPIKFFTEQIHATSGRGQYAHPRDVATVLRALGWTRTRKWRSEAEAFRALWYPPTD